MNPVLHQIAATASLGVVGGIMTVLFFLCFVGWAAWAWSPKNRARLASYANIPFDDETPGGQP